MLKGRKSEWDQDIMFCNVGTIIGSHCNCWADAWQDCIFWPIAGRVMKGYIILYLLTMHGHPIADRPVLTNSARSYLRRPDFLMPPARPPARPRPVLIVIVHQGSSHGHPDMNCKTISSPRFGSVLPLAVFTGDVYVNFSGGSGEQSSRSSALADIHPRFCVWLYVCSLLFQLLPGYSGRPRMYMICFKSQDVRGGSSPPSFAALSHPSIASC